MEKIKLLLYCTKSKPYLVKEAFKGYMATNNLGVLEEEKERFILNGKIVAECDYEVEEIDYINAEFVFNRYYLEVLDKSCLTDKEMYEYLKGKNGYAIHIKNLHIFDKPRELSEYSKRIGDDFQVLGNAPQNMMKCCEIKYMIEDYILISIRPEWLCKILNGEKTIEVRKKVLKEMMPR